MTCHAHDSYSCKAVAKVECAATMMWTIVDDATHALVIGGTHATLDL